MGVRGGLSSRHSLRSWSEELMFARERRSNDPGYFRATKKWDLIVVSNGALVLAMEFKSQARKSIGNNVNNRSEEAVGSAKDIWTAFREGRFGAVPSSVSGLSISS